ncbi:type VII secretion target [Kitasatospora sp. NPDC054939]
MAGSGFQVQPTELEGAGRTAQKTAGDIPGETKDVLGASDRAEAGLKGFSTGAELNTCTDSWRATLDALAAEMDRQGGNLITTAQNYRKAESSNAGALAKGGA